MLLRSVVSCSVKHVLFTAKPSETVAAEERTDHSDHSRRTCVRQDGVDPERCERSSAGPLAGGLQWAGAGCRGAGGGHQVKTAVQLYLI